MPTAPGSRNGTDQLRPQGNLDIGNQDDDGSLTADGHTWELRRERRSARAETDGKAPMTAVLANYLSGRWVVTLDGRSYSLRTRHWFGGSWVLRDETGADVGSVFRDSVNSRLHGGRLDGAFSPVVSNAAGLFVLYLVATVRRDNNRSGGGRIAPSSG
jgi:hypothetical protein